MKTGTRFALIKRYLPTNCNGRCSFIRNIIWSVIMKVMQKMPCDLAKTKTKHACLLYNCAHMTMSYSNFQQI